MPFRQRIHPESPASDLKLPGGHCVHEASSIAKPALHLHAGLPSAASVWAGQMEHVVAPICRENLPAWQRVQLDDPLLAAYFPARQSRHVANFPAMQSLQKDSPSDGEYFPLSQAEQVPASLWPPVAADRYLAALHSWQVPASVAPVTMEYLPAEHRPEHADSDVAPAAAENLPAAQSAQADKPAVAPNLPAGHVVHAASQLSPPPSAALVLYEPAGHCGSGQICQDTDNLFRSRGTAVCLEIKFRRSGPPKKRQQQQQQQQQLGQNRDKGRTHLRNL